MGKTSTKDLISSVLAGSRRTFASEKSFNNELGVPLTLINAPDDVEVVVVEMMDQLLPGFDQVNGPVIALALPAHLGVAAALRSFR